MTYHPPPPREPSGCIQTLVITRIIFGILAIPIALIMGAIFAVILFLFAFGENVFLGLGVLVLIGFLFYLVIMWEKRRVEREIPRDDDYWRR